MARCLSVILFLIIVNISLCFAAKAIAPAKQPAVLKTDTVTVSQRHFDKDALTRYSKRPEFQYHEDIAEPSLWTRFWRWFWSLFDFSEIKPVNAGGFWPFVLMILKYLFLIVGIGAIIFVILKMIGIDLINLFGRKSVQATLPYTESLENIHEINFDTEIENAINTRNYRLAVRLLYLKCLKQLNDANLIDWQPDKTNHNYINELGSNPQSGAFKNLTRQFEYVWYGEFPIDGDLFKNINTMFQQFKPV
jgi:hypothetical protein